VHAIGPFELTDYLGLEKSDHGNLLDRQS
jgi:hypothetical protein